MKLAPSAERDLQEIYDYIASAASDDFASEFVERLLTALRLLEGIAAGAGSPRPELGTDVRSWPIGRYVAYYRERRGRIEVARIRHGSRDPQTRSLD